VSSLHLIYISGDHIKEQEILNICMSGYNILSSFCVIIICIFVREDMLYQAVDLKKTRAEKIFEMYEVYI